MSWWQFSRHRVGLFRSMVDIGKNAFGFDQNDAALVLVCMFEGRDQDAMNSDGLAILGE